MQIEPTAPVAINHVREARKRAGLTQEALARAAGISGSFLSRLERMEAAARMPTRITLAPALQAPIRDLFPDTVPAFIEVRQGYGGVLVSHLGTRTTFGATSAEEVADAGAGVLTGPPVTGGRVHVEEEGDNL